MVRKIINNLVYVGMLALLGGLLYYSVNRLWDWKVEAAVYGGLALMLISAVANFDAIRAVLTSRGARYGSIAGATVLLVLGILVLVNFMNFRYHKRVDLSENQLYALSEQSQKVVKNLDQEVQVIGFFQGDSASRRFQDLMAEYRYDSPKFDYAVSDPQKDPSKAEQYGVKRMGEVVVVSGPKTEVVDQYNEEKITNAIIKVTRKGEKVIYFLEGHGEKDIAGNDEKGYSEIKTAIEKQNYVVKSYNLAQENKIPEDATVIVSAGPEMNFLPNEVELLNKYMASGGKFLLLVDPKNRFSMKDFLSPYGLSLDEDVVVDVSGIGQLFGFSAAAPIVADYGNHPITKDLKRVMSVFPMAQSVSTTTSSLGYQDTKLLSTSRQSWGETELTGDSASFDEGKDKKGPLDLAAVATHAVAPPAADPKSQAASKDDKPKGKEARFVLFGDSDFASNAYVNTAANKDVFLNTISWLAEDTDLIAMRPKNPEDRRLNLTAAESQGIFWLTVVLLPVATLGVGLTVWFRRR